MYHMNVQYKNDNNCFLFLFSLMQFDCDSDMAQLIDRHHTHKHAEHSIVSNLSMKREKTSDTTEIASESAKTHISE